MAYTTTEGVRAVLAMRREPGDTSTYANEAVERAITYAEMLVDTYCGRHFRAVDEIEERVPGYEPGYGWHILTGHPILSVSEVVDSEDAVVPYEIISHALGIVSVGTAGVVRITYTYNDPANPCPAEIANITAQVAANILANPPSWLKSTGTPIPMLLDDPPAVYLPADIRAVLNRYKHI